MKYRPIEHKLARALRAVNRVDLYADMISVKTTYQMDNQGGGLRGAVRGFSKNSRRNLMHKMCMWRVAGYALYFITLTYPEKYSDDWQIWKRDFATFVKWLVRNFEQGACACWRVEFQKRGAPHFHLIVCTKGDIDETTVKRMLLKKWAQVVRDGYEQAGGDTRAYEQDYIKHSKHGIDIRPIKNGRRQLMAYVSKYLAKVTDDQTIMHERQYGRNWGFVSLQDECDFTPYDTLNMPIQESKIIKRIVMRWLRSKGKQDYAKSLRTKVSWSVMGVGADGFGRAIVDHARDTLITSHIRPNLYNTPFLERVNTGLVAGREALTHDTLVSTPRGQGRVGSTSGHRVSVFLNDGSYSAFDLREVMSVKQVTIKQGVLI